MATIGNLTPFPYTLSPLNNITPFSYKDGATYLEILENLSTYMTTLVPSMDDELTGIIADFQAGITNAENTVTTAQGGWQAAFNSFMIDVTAQIALLNDSAISGLVNDVVSQTGSTLKLLYSGRDSVVIDVKNYGAKGDGITDDSPAIIAAMEVLRTRNGGTLFFPPGEYYMSDCVDLVSNIEIFGSGATLRKLYSTDPSYIFFRGPSNGKVGYASGGSNVSIRNLTFRGSFLAGGRGGCAVATNHWSNIVVRDCVFTELHGQGHIFDLGAADNVLIENSIFEGSNRNFSGNNSNSEYIQFDVSNVNALSFPDLPNSCDGASSKNIMVRNCIFRPLTVGGMTYGTGSPFGNHSVSEGMPHENISFIDNLIINPLDAPVANFKGVLHFTGVKGLTIKGNKFLNGNNVDNNAICVYNGAGGYSAAKSNSTDNPYYNFTTPISPENVDISNNDFVGWKSVLGLSDSIIRFNGNAALPALNVSISNNNFKDCSPAGYVGSLAQICISVGFVSRLRVNGNTGDVVGRFHKINNVTDAEINGNVVNDTSNIPITVTDSNRVNIRGNSVTKYTSDAITINNTIPVTKITVSDNKIVDGKSADRNAIIANMITDTIFCGNMITNAVTMARGIYVWGTSADNIALSNIIKGCTETITGPSITKTGNIPA